MAAERICGFCGRANPADMPRCINCGQRVAGGLLLQDETATIVNREPWWRASTGKNGQTTIPLPPQVREEVARAESLRVEAERKAEQERIAQELKAAEGRKRQAEEEAWRRTLGQSVAQTLGHVAEVRNATTAKPGPVKTTAGKNVAQTCAKCNAPIGEAGAVFSFCVHCGADLAPSSTVASTSSTVGVSPAHWGQTGHTVTTAKTGIVNIQAETPKTQGMNPVVPAALSFFWPGFGQFANGQAAKGVLLLLAAFVATVVLGWQSMGFFMIIGRVLAAVDAYRIAERRRSGKPVREGEWDLG
jgi:TM2 domain-containing membrane protein YozV